MAIRVRVSGLSSIDSKVKKLAQNLTLESIDRVVAQSAVVTHKRLVNQTPKKWTGDTRRAWQVRRISNGHWRVSNSSKVMGFLEKGTRQVVPKNGKFLFIPLTRGAFFAGARGVFSDKERFKFGRDYVLAKRARGIRARRIVEKHRPIARVTLKASMRLHIRKSLNS